jgi:hypothetical protein
VPARPALALAFGFVAFAACGSGDRDASLAASLATGTCVRAAPTFTVTATPSGPVAADTPVTYAIGVTNHDGPGCPATSTFLSLAGPDGDATHTDDGLELTRDKDDASIAPGATATFTVTLTASDDTDAGAHAVPFTLVSPDAASLFGSLGFTLMSPDQGGDACAVPSKTVLLIRDPSVVDDPVRTGPGGAWTFGRLARDLAKTPDDAPAMVLALFSTWLADQSVNGFTVTARPAMKKLVLDAWPRTGTGALDLDRAPLRLLAIVNRTDLRDLARGQAGEGRFVFGLLDAHGAPQEFTLIVEYALPAASADDVLAWARDWHALGRLAFPSATYNAALESVTERFSGRGAGGSGRPNASALAQIRTNDFALVARWELRQFALDAASGRLLPRPVAETPDLSWSGTAGLTGFVDANAAALLADACTLPASLGAKPFLAGSVFNDIGAAWTAPDVANPDARFHFALGTCNGCHSERETNTSFLQIAPRAAGETAAISPFLAGTIAHDAVTGAARKLDEIARRRADLKTLVCSSPGARAVAMGLARAHGGEAGSSPPAVHDR